MLTAAENLCKIISGNQHTISECSRPMSIFTKFFNATCKIFHALFLILLYRATDVSH